MRKRILVTLCATFGVMAVGVVPALADNPTRRGTDWACIGIDQLEFGVCQQNPLPDRLPVPDEARVLPPEED